MANILIIGGSSGIGKQLATQLDEKGHQLWVSYNETKVESTASITAFQYNVLHDVFPTDDLPDTLDALVYCPGAIQLKPFQHISSDDVLDDYKLQVGGAIKVLQACLSKLKKSEQASVVLFSTVAVQAGFPFHAQVSASKGAIEGLTRALAAEFSPDIRVNAVAPSITDTPLAKKILGNEKKRANLEKQNPMKRIGQPSDIANAVQFLLSNETSWVTGQVIHVDGGQSVIQ